MMEMDGRDSAKCQKSKKGHNGYLFESLNGKKKDKIATVTISYIRKAKRKRGGEGGDAVGCWICVLERESASL